MHIGGTRWAAVGDALGRLLEASGAEVTREYYFNDAGAQIDRFARACWPPRTAEPVPEDGYAGEYIDDIAAAGRRRASPACSSCPTTSSWRSSGPRGVELMFDEIQQLAGRVRRRLRRLLQRDGRCTSRARWTKAIARLREQGHVYEADGAVWLRTTDFGDDKDRVLVKGDGEPTYFAADCAYYLDKRERGFDKVVIMLGADHTGYVGRYKALVAAIGDDPDDATSRS